MHTHTQTFHRRSWSVDGAGAGPPTSQVTCASWVCSPPARTHVALLGPCFKTGGWEAFRQHREDAVPRGDSVERPLLPRASGRQGRRIERRACPARPLDADQRPAHAAGRSGRREPGRTRDFPSLPPQQFQVLFNSLFKVLFIFPSRYLFAIGLPPVFSLRWDLPPDLGCIPKQPDSAKAPRGAAGRAPTGFSPSPTLPSSRLGRCPPQRTPLQTTIRRPQAGDFHDGLFPLRSPLLGESWLVSSPPPTDMLKLSGWSCLNSGRT